MKKKLIISDHDDYGVSECDVVGFYNIHRIDASIYDNVWIQLIDFSNNILVIRYIRNSDNWNVNIYCSSDNIGLVEYCDGICNNHSEFIIQSKSNGVLTTPNCELKHRPLLYLLSRNKEVIRPSLCRKSDYRYPVLEIFSIKSQYEWFNAMITDGLIDSVSNQSKSIYTCPKCYGNAFNFNEQCTHCNSDDIVHTSLIHCFVCGHISSDDIKKSDDLNCPSCKTKWVHKGVDYEYILDAVECNNCGTKAQHTQTKLECLDCGSMLKHDELKLHKYGLYQITKKVYDLNKVVER